LFIKNWELELQAKSKQAEKFPKQKIRPFLGGADPEAILHEFRGVNASTSIPTSVERDIPIIYPFVVHNFYSFSEK
jgi:hypothetical protein